MVLGAIVTFRITYSIPSAISHTLSYGSVTGTCSSTIFYFIENDTVTDGTQREINVTDASTNNCQNSTVGGLKINNNGNANINVTMEINQSEPTGVMTIAGFNASSYQGAGCTRTPPQGPTNTTCVNITHSAPSTIAINLGIGGNQTVWVWADFVSADLGAGVGNAATTLRQAATNSTQTT